MCARGALMIKRCLFSVLPPRFLETLRPLFRALKGHQSQPVQSFSRPRPFLLWWHDLRDDSAAVPSGAVWI